MFRRNKELHDSGLAFDDLSDSSWLAPLYEVCEILCDSLSMNLEDLLGEENAGTAAGLIAVRKADVHSKVKELIKNHRAVFESKDEKTQKRLLKRKTRRRLAKDQTSLECECPSCAQPGQLIGGLATDSAPFLRDSQLFLRRTYRAVSFTCPVCDLSLSSVSHLLAAKVRPTFEIEVELDLHEVFEMDFGEDYFNM